MTRVWDTGFEVSPNGTVLTTSNTSYQAMVGGGTGTKLSSNTAAALHTGSFSAKFASTATDTAAGAYTFTDRTQFYYRGYLTWSNSTPAVQVILVTVKDNANSLTVCQVTLDTTGHLRLRNGAAATLSTSTGVPGANTIVELEIDVTNVGGTPHVTARAQWGANLDTFTYNWDAGDNTTANSNVGRVVEGSSTTEAITVWVDDSAGDDINQPGPKGLTSVPPVSDAGPDQTVEPFSTVTLDGTGSTFTSPDSGVTYTWAQTVGPAVTIVNPLSATPSFVAPAGTADITLTFSLVVTGNESLLADATADLVTITVLAATEFYLNGSGTWTSMQILSM